MRYLAATFLESTLQRGASLEQFMGGVIDAGQRLVRWVELRPTNTGIEIWDCFAPDLGEECIDLYALASVELEPFAIVSDAAQALVIAQSRLGTTPLRWVNQGMSQDEFLRFLQSGRPAQWSLAGA